MAGHAQLVKCYAALEPLRAIPPLPSPLSLDALAAYCRTLGYPYSSTSALLLIDFLAAELQAARLTLAARREERASRTAAPVTLDGELYLLVKALAIPSVTDDALRNAAERVVAQIKAKVAVLLGKLPLNFFDMHVPLMDQKLATPAVLVRGRPYVAACCAHTIYYALCYALTPQWGAQPQ